MRTLILEKTQNLRVESKTVTTRQQNCHEKLPGRAHLCRRSSTLPSIWERQCMAFAGTRREKYIFLIAQPVCFPHYERPLKI